MSRCVPILALIVMFAILANVTATDDDINIIVDQAVEYNKKISCAGVVTSWMSCATLYGTLLLKSDAVDKVCRIGDEDKVYVGSAVPMQNSGTKNYHPWYFKLKSGRDYQLIQAYLRYTDKKPFRAWIVPESVLRSNIDPNLNDVKKIGYWIYLILDPANVPGWMSRYEIPGTTLP